jgi:3D (Asp-Asp-Asp) domain-containing protein
VMHLSGSIWRKAFVTALAAAGFVWLLEVTMLDSRHLVLPTGFRVASFRPSAPAPVRLNFTATAYCKGPVTAAGVTAKAGVVASDPALLPIGSVVQLDVRNDKYDGIYTVLDTGPSVEGREIDIYMWSCYEALDFGRQPVEVTVLRLGWNPTATSRPFMDRLFRRPE